MPEPNMIGKLARMRKLCGRSTDNVAESRGTFDIVGTSTETELLESCPIESVRFTTSANSSIVGNPENTCGGGI